MRKIQIALLYEYKYEVKNVEELFRELEHCIDTPSIQKSFCIRKTS